MLPLGQKVGFVIMRPTANLDFFFNSPLSMGYYPMFGVVEEGPKNYEPKSCP